LGHYRTEIPTPRNCCPRRTAPFWKKRSNIRNDLLSLFFHRNTGTNTRRVSQTIPLPPPLSRQWYPGTRYSRSPHLGTIFFLGTSSSHHRRLVEEVPAPILIRSHHFLGLLLIRIRDKSRSPRRVVTKNRRIMAKVRNLRACNAEKVDVVVDDL
jgi:hypothetical protein